MRRQPADLAAKSQRGRKLIQDGPFEDAVPNKPGFLMNFGLALHMAG